MNVVHMLGICPGNQGISARQIVTLSSDEARILYIIGQLAKIVLHVLGLPSNCLTQFGLLQRSAGAS